MADITIHVAGRAYTVAAHEGEEPHLRKLEAMIEAHAETAKRASGGLNAERTLVYLALILADQIDEMANRPPEGVSTLVLERIADRLEAVAMALEERVQTA